MPASWCGWTRSRRSLATEPALDSRLVDVRRWRGIRAWSALLLVVVALYWLLRPESVAVPLQLHSAYLWQRDWTDAVRASLRGTSAVAELRVLALEVDAAGQIRVPRPDLNALHAANVRVVPVVRIDGRRPPLAAGALAAQLTALRAEWMRAGLTIDELEIDHDCARSALADYRSWLADLKQQLPAGLKLALTGLPDWLESPELPALVAVVDVFTLQVHAVDQPDRGIFDARRATGWARRFASSVDRPFFLALPTYAARIRGTLYWAEPEQIESLLSALVQEPVPGLLGVRWFRLPVAGQSDTWSAATLDALIRQQPRSGAVLLKTIADGRGLIDLSLDNPDRFDWPLPLRISVRGDCIGDAANGFVLQNRPGESGGLVFLRQEADRLAPGRRRALGWLRCQAQPEISIETSENPVGARLERLDPAGTGLRAVVSARFAE